MFKGEYTHTIDAKGRLIIPAKYREALGFQCTIAKGRDGALNIYTEADWKKFDEKFEKMPQSDPRVRKYIRDFYGNASDIFPDNNGRIMIPQNLKEYAGLKKDVVTVGAFDHIEIWDAERYNSYINDDTFSDEDIAETLAQFGL